MIAPAFIFPKKHRILILAVLALAGRVFAGVDTSPVQVGNYSSPIRVSCVGDSITAGGYPTSGTDFPTQLGKMLGPQWNVMNFGRSGTAATRSTSASYYLYEQYANAIDSAPDVVVMQLGTNDANPNNNWPSASTTYKEDYRWLIRQFKNLPSHPRIFLCRPTYSTSSTYPEANLVIIRTWVEELANEESTGLIDNELVTKGYNEYNANDGVHPNATGYGRIAENIYHSFTGEAFPGNIMLRAGVGKVYFNWYTYAASQPYSISRSANGGTPAVLASGITSGTYTDATISQGNTYTYTFSTTNVYGTSSTNPVGTAATSPDRVLTVTADTGWVNRTSGGVSSAGAATDGLDTTDWASGSTGQTASLQYDHGIYSNWAVASYRLISSSGSSASDPSAWLFQGSNNGTTWTTLDTQSGQSFTTRRQAKRYSFSNGTPYRYHRLNVTATQGGSSGVSLAEFQIASQDSNPLASANVEPSGAAASNVFDSLTATKWYNGITNGSGTSGWIQYLYAGGEARALSSYRLTSATDVQQRDPKDWQFQGSNDGAVWTTLDTQASQVFSSRSQTSSYPLSTVPWRYYRLNVTANAGGGSYGLQLAELTLVDAVAPPATPGAPALSVVGGTNSLSWSAAGGATTYSVKRAFSPDGPYVMLIRGLTTTGFTDTTAVGGVTYYYTLTATNSGGDSAASASVTTAGLTAPPAAPTGVSASGQNLAVNLVWSTSTGASGYSVKRSVWNGGPYTTIATGVTGNSYLDQGLLNGTTYYYALTASGTGGESGNSLQAIAAPQVVTSLPARPFLHPLFADHVVLQRDAVVPVWGWAAPGVQVSVTINGQTKTTTTAATGRWQVEVGPFVAGGPYSMTVTGQQTVTVGDILFGDVFLFSGQSNMERQLGPRSGQPLILNYQAEAAAADFPNIRQFSIPLSSAAQEKQVPSGSWGVCNPTSVLNFSAVGFFTARNLYQNTHVPIGIIHSAYGGTRIDPWLEPQEAARYPEFAGTVNSLPGSSSPGANVSAIHNSMVAPLAPFRIKGAFWYQGESSSDRPDQYSSLLPSLIRGWRRVFGQPNLPVIVIQLPGYSTAVTTPVQAGSWAEMREAQKTGIDGDRFARLVTTIDIGNSDIHPPDKQDVGQRAALAALDVAYGQTLVSQGPLFTGATVQGGSIRCSFSNTGGGLMVGSKANLTATTEVAGGTLTGFALAAADKVWVLADAVIDGNTVVVSSASVTTPLYVRYGWANMPSCNLYNKITDGGGNVVDGLPASPFRNDPVSKLNVVSGSGSGDYARGSQVNIASNVVTGGAFSFWSGDTSQLASPGTTTTTAYLGRGYTSVGANYQPVFAPSGLTATAGSLSVTLNWTAQGNATSYNIKRSTSSTGPFSTIASGVLVTTYVDNTTGFGTPYYYRISASNPAGDGPESTAQVSATATPPGAPAGFTAAAGNGVVNLAWNPVGNVSGYTVSRSTVSGGPYTTILSQTPGTSYVDTALNNGTTYYYTVAALVSGSAGPAAGEVSATPAAAAPSILRSMGGTVSASVENGTNEAAAKAFDGKFTSAANDGTKWFTAFIAMPQWLQYRFTAGVGWAVNEYRITSANDSPTRDPKDWLFQASFDGINWVTLHSVTGESFASRYLTKTYAFTNTTVYPYYRLYVTAVPGGGTTGLQLAELRLFSSASDQGDKTPPVFDATPNLNAQTTSASGASVAYSIVANDTVSGFVQPACTPASGSLFPVGVTTVNCAAIDLAGNKATASFTVTVVNTAAAVSIAAPSISMNGTSVQLSIQSIAGHTYQLQRSYTLADGSWENVGTARTGEGTLDFSDTPDLSTKQAFYRIVTDP